MISVSGLIFRAGGAGSPRTAYPGAGLAGLAPRSPMSNHMVFHSADLFFRVVVRAPFKIAWHNNCTHLRRVLCISYDCVV